MKLTKISSDQGLIRLRCEGLISFPGVVTNANPIEQVLGIGCYSNKVLLNLESADGIDSSGVGWLISCHRQFQNMNGKLVLHTIPPLVRNVLELLRMETYLNMARNEEEALALLAENNK